MCCAGCFREHRVNGTHSSQSSSTRKIYGICRLEPDVPVPSGLEERDSFRSPGPRESFPLSVKSNGAGKCACREEPAADEIEGTLGFSLTGVLASVAAPLADAGISVFAVTTYDTDYLLVSTEDLREATQALKLRGHAIRQS